MRPTGADLMRDRFFGRRRRETEALVERGKQQGAIRTDVATGLIVDLLFGPLIFRLFNGLGAVTPAEARVLAALSVAAVQAPTKARRRRA